MKRSEIKLAYPSAYLFPSDLCHLFLSFLLQIAEEALVMADAVDGVGKGVDIPVVDFEAVVKNLSASALLGDDGWRATTVG